ncbi:uncharacterized protein EI90DRAFT_3036547 [Cantharellus anzutake]|uniref:uncharacterized protein n=1 Tax=Cantharellus anzutake TaxID=1750568 RepID=UPI001904D439|nr:uncharacterized protein EI90DRAFT_3036547 [Cantharellus anzutake]KAF8340708.1 hypothetical protein EI90DRAFT_3036547 [Cantharellus anzutake]
MPRMLLTNLYFMPASVGECVSVKPFPQLPLPRMQQWGVIGYKSADGGMLGSEHLRIFYARRRLDLWTIYSIFYN